MVDVMHLSRDGDYQTKCSILERLQREGFIDNMRAQLRAQVIKCMEGKFGAAALASDISNAVTRKVIQTDEGLLCAEVIREFLNFYKMEYSTQVFLPEMGLQSSLPKVRWELERDLGIRENGDHSKPLLLKLIEQSRGETP